LYLHQGKCILPFDKWSYNDRRASDHGHNFSVDDHPDVNDRRASDHGHNIADNAGQETSVDNNGPTSSPALSGKEGNDFDLIIGLIDGGRNDSV
jgi:hypothetical protein